MMLDAATTHKPLLPSKALCALTLGAAGRGTFESLGVRWNGMKNPTDVILFSDRTP